jgi:hypothetical protein
VIGRQLSVAEEISFIANAKRSLYYLPEDSSSGIVIRGRPFSAGLFRVGGQKSDTEERRQVVDAKRLLQYLPEGPSSGKTP